MLLLLFNGELFIHLVYYYGLFAFFLCPLFCPRVRARSFVLLLLCTVLKLCAFYVWLVRATSAHTYLCIITSYYCDVCGCNGHGLSWRWYTSVFVVLRCCCWYGMMMVDAVCCEWLLLLLLLLLLYVSGTTNQNSGSDFINLGGCNFFSTFSSSSSSSLLSRIVRFVPFAAVTFGFAAQLKWLRSERNLCVWAGWNGWHATAMKEWCTSTRTEVDLRQTKYHHKLWFWLI